MMHVIEFAPRRGVTARELCARADREVEEACASVEAEEPPRRPDGSVDVRALCRALDEAANAGASDVPAWSEADARAAEREGWAIFWCIGAGADGPVQLQRLDNPADWEHAPDPYPFDDDTDVWEHVWRQAQAGSQLHVRALARIRALNPAEADAIERWVAARAQEASA